MLIAIRLASLFGPLVLLTPIVASAQNEGAQGGDGLQEITVTATRREETIRDVPLSVSAFSQDTMEQRGVKSFEDVVAFTPGVTFPVAPSVSWLPGSNNSVTIRGILSEGAGPETTGIYIDDIPIQVRTNGIGSSNPMPQIFDLERVEVLRGPQGTLFGAGSMGGTVRFITPQPSLTEFSSSVRGEFSSIENGAEDYYAGAVFGGPLVHDKSGFRVSAMYRREGGWVDRVDNSSPPTSPVVLDSNSNTSEAEVFRAAVTWAPIEALSITPSLLYQDVSTVDSASFWESFSNPDGGEFRNGNPLTRSGTDRYLLSALAIQYELPKMTFFSSTAYYDRENLLDTDYTVFIAGVFGFNTPVGPRVPGVPNYQNFVNLDNRQRSFTQEFRLSSIDSNARLNWTAGLFYQKQHQFNREPVHDPMLEDLTMSAFGAAVVDVFGVPLFRGDLSFFAHSELEDSQAAAFGEINFALSKKLKLTAGMRYARMEFKNDSMADGPFNGGPTTHKGEQSEKPFTPKLGLTYNLNPDNMFYATYSEGFRGGGATSPPPFEACEDELRLLGFDKSPSAFGSDSVESFEIGAKNGFFQNRLQVSSSVFHIDWSDIQTNVFLPNCGFSFTANTGKARSEGFDVQIDALPFKRLELSLTAGYADAEYTEDTVTGIGPTGPVLIVSKGDKLPGPYWSGSLSVDYRFSAFTRSAYIRGDYQYVGASREPLQAMNPRNNAFDPATYRSPDTNRVNARVGVEVGSWEVALFAENLFNETPIVTRNNTARGEELFLLTSFRPRTVGVAITGRF